MDRVKNHQNRVQPLPSRSDLRDGTVVPVHVLTFSNKKTTSTLSNERVP